MEMKGTNRCGRWVRRWRCKWWVPSVQGQGEARPEEWAGAACQRPLSSEMLVLLGDTR